METPRTFYLLDPFSTIPTEDSSKWLGRIVKSFSNPREAFTPEFPNISSSNIQTDSNFTNVQAVLDRGQSTSARAVLDGLFSLSRQESHSQSPSFKATKVQRVRLLQDEERFSEILGSDISVRAKVLDWLGIARPAYFIVGFLMTDRIAFSSGASRSSGVDGFISAPLKAAAATQGVFLAGKEPIEVGASSSTTESSTVGTKISGSRIFAIEYRIIKRRLLSVHHDVDMQRHRLTGARMFAPSGRSPVRSDERTRRQNVEVLLDEEPMSEVEAAEDLCLTL